MRDGEEGREKREERRGEERRGKRTNTPAISDSGRLSEYGTVSYDGASGLNPLRHEQQRRFRAGCRHPWALTQSLSETRDVLGQEAKSCASLVSPQRNNHDGRTRAGKTCASLRRWRAEDGEHDQSNTEQARQIRGGVRMSTASKAGSLWMGSTVISVVSESRES